MVVSLAVLVLVPNFVAALLVLVLAGLSWTTTISTLVAELMLFLPKWVMARGMAIWTMVFTGCQAIGAVLWGLVAGQVGLTSAFLIAAALSAVAVGIGLVRRVPDAGESDPNPVAYWSEARVSLDPDPSAGPVQVAVTYTISPDHEQAWRAAMGLLRRSRLKTGAFRWELYRDAARPDRFLEQFWIATWDEHLRQHNGRLTDADQQVEQAALAFSDPPATADHLLPP
jgi:MFS family permease